MSSWQHLPFGVSTPPWFWSYWLPNKFYDVGDLVVYQGKRAMLTDVGWVMFPKNQPRSRRCLNPRRGPHQADVGHPIQLPKQSLLLLNWSKLTRNCTLLRFNGEHTKKPTKELAMSEPTVTYVQRLTKTDSYVRVASNYCGDAANVSLTPIGVQEPPYMVELAQRLAASDDLRWSYYHTATEAIAAAVDLVKARGMQYARDAHVDELRTAVAHWRAQHPVT